MGRKKVIFHLPGLCCAFEVRGTVQPQDICWGLEDGEGKRASRKEDKERAVGTSQAEFVPATDPGCPATPCCSCELLSYNGDQSIVSGQHYSPCGYQNQCSHPFISLPSQRRQSPYLRGLGEDQPPAMRYVLTTVPGRQAMSPLETTLRSLYFQLPILLQGQQIRMGPMRLVIWRQDYKTGQPGT